MYESDNPTSSGSRMQLIRFHELACLCQLLKRKI